MIINSREETEKQIYTVPTSQILLHDKKSSYYDVISSLAYPECNHALGRICERFDYNKIVEIIDSTPFISDIQKVFYKHMILQRFNLIVKDSYERMTESEKA